MGNISTITFGTMQELQDKFDELRLRPDSKYYCWNNLREYNELDAGKNVLQNGDIVWYSAGSKSDCLSKGIIVEKPHTYYLTVRDKNTNDETSYNFIGSAFHIKMSNGRFKLVRSNCIKV